jgi:hypothetical protein
MRQHIHERIRLLLGSFFGQPFAEKARHSAFGPLQSSLVQGFDLFVIN